MVSDKEPSRRDFLSLTAGAMGLIAAGAAGWVAIDSMNPAADTIAKYVVDVDLSNIQPGDRTTVVWKHRPIFIFRRSPSELKEARKESLSEFRYPESDEARVKKGHDEWLVVIGVCTSCGCILMGNKLGQPRGNWEGWMCPCCGSSYDLSGRVRNGPAPKNLKVPNYRFFTDKVIRFDIAEGVIAKGVGVN